MYFLVQSAQLPEAPNGNSGEKRRMLFKKAQIVDIMKGKRVIDLLYYEEMSNFDKEKHI